VYSINNANHFNPYINAHPLATQHASQAPAPRPVSRPGAGIAMVNRQPVTMTPLSRTGFFSAFSTQRTSLIARRAQTPIPSRFSQQILADRRRLSEQAARDLDAMSTLDLRNLNYTYQDIAEKSQHHINRFSRAEVDTICEALDDYQTPHGDNFLMNISAMGYPSLDNYLHATGHTDENSVNDFIHQFLHRYGDESHDADNVKETRTRLAGRLAEPTRALQHFIHTSPRLSGIPLLKGAAGNDLPVTTQVNGQNTVTSALHGQAINFNIFLSTTIDFDVAVSFSGHDERDDFGRPMFTVDLNSNSLESEVLRRAALTGVQRNEFDTEAIVYYFKCSGVTGISVNATKASAYPHIAPDNLSSEDEILLNPGHFFQPEQLIFYERGTAMIGTLEYGRN
jgi:hypothetical protein